MKKTKSRVNEPSSTSDNPNVKAHHEHHKEEPLMGGLPAGENEGSETGSRGDHRKQHTNHVTGGSRTSKK